MKSMTTKKLTRIAVLMGLTTIMTMIIQIPTIGTSGYLNLGDMVVFLGAMVLGRGGGFLVGGLGSALADLLLGYTHYAPVTFVVKGFEGYIAGALLDTKIGGKKPIFATTVASIWMAFGYYIGEIFMYGTRAALLSVPGNLMQGILGASIAVILHGLLKRTRLV